ncbi:MAG: aminotransferase class V-fold PLP-dependent enzyme [Gemmatimonadota bacterium]|nr:aminotransferase class V-fold PLP-dependent enzyme [Gemmatimonadota bacterium]
MAEQLPRRTVLKLGAMGALSLAIEACRPEGVVEAAGVRTLRRPVDVDDAAWSAVRAQFMIDAGTAYMNNASLGMPPKPVVDAVAAGYVAISEEPVHGKHDLQSAIAERVMPRLGALFGVTASEISLTRNATEALHLQTLGARLRPGDQVIITTQEHPAGARPWQLRAAREGIRVVEVMIPSPLPPTPELVARMESAVGRETRAIAFCHVTRGGHLYPVAELCAMARRRGLLSFVDGAQAVGQFPINLRELGCDAYSASLHKWMLGPVGTGFLYVSESSRDRIVTTFDPEATVDMPQHGPPGTADFPVRAAIDTALDFVTTLGLDRIEARCRYLSDYLKRRLDELDDVELLSGRREQSAPGQTIFEKAGLNAASSVPLLEQIAASHVDEHQRDGHNAIRVSTHVYNTLAEIDRLVDALSRA